MTPHFQNSFFSTFFNVFCAKVEDGTLESYWKPNTSVLSSTSWILLIFIHFGAFLLLCGLVSIYFTIFFMGSEVCLERCNFYGNLGLKKKSNNFILREFCKRTHCPPIVTLALLLFLSKTQKKNMVNKCFDPWGLPQKTFQLILHQVIERKLPIFFFKIS